VVTTDALDHRAGTTIQTAEILRRIDAVPRAGGGEGCQPGSDFRQEQIQPLENTATEMPEARIPR
jgi:hypothetical protein